MEIEQYLVKRVQQDYQQLPINWEKIPDDFVYFIWCLIGPDFDLHSRFFKRDVPEHKGLNIVAQYVDIEYLAGLEWFIKLEWDSRHKFTCGKPKQLKIYKPKGEVFSALLRLIERCLTFKGKFDLPCLDVKIIDSPTWFYWVIHESRMFDVYDSLWGEETKSYQGRRKQGLFAAKRVFITKLNQLQNPIPHPDTEPFIELKREATYWLYETAIALAEKYNQFRQNYWSPYVKALRSELNHKNSPEWKVGIPEVDGLILPLGGKGRGGKKIEAWNP